jgi:orotidine-5'-phosphate decarboxylase
MTGTVTANSAADEAKRRLIVALDVDAAAKARRVIADLGDLAGGFKVGMQLFTAAGPEFVRELATRGTRIFLDLKYHDIPNTVARAGVEAARLGVWMFNMHAAGGSEMMRRTRAEVAETCEREGITRPSMIAVTVLTSSGSATLRETGIDAEAEDHVVRLARLAVDAGLDGVVAAPGETKLIRGAIPDADLIIVTPGVRPVSATLDDQRRVMTPGEAAANGSDYLVVGRPIIESPDMRSAAESIIAEIGSALKPAFES